MKCTPHSHFIDLPNGRRIRTNKDCNIDDIEDDEELGNIFKTLGKVAKALGSVAKPVMTAGGATVGGIFGGPQGAMIGGQVGGGVGGAIQKASKGKKKGAKLPDEAAPETAHEVTPPHDLATIPPEQHLDVLKEIISGVPEAIRNEVVTALKQTSLQKAADDKEISSVVSGVTSKFAPEMNAVLQILKKNQIQQQATQEHKALVKADKMDAVLLGIDKKVTKLDKKVSNLDNLATSLGKARMAASLFGVPSKML
jgi:hypothetical protein